MDARIITEMREWVSDCEWIEDADEIMGMSDEEILRGVDRHYEGGVAAFMETVR